MKPPLPLEVFPPRSLVSCPRTTAALALAIAFAAGFNAAVWLACLIATHS